MLAVKWEAIDVFADHHVSDELRAVDAAFDHLVAEGCARHLALAGFARDLLALVLAHDHARRLDVDHLGDLVADADADPSADRARALGARDHDLVQHARQPWRDGATTRRWLRRPVLLLGSLDVADAVLELRIRLRGRKLGGQLLDLLEQLQQRRGVDTLVFRRAATRGLDGVAELLARIDALQEHGQLVGGDGHRRRSWLHVGDEGEAAALEPLVHDGVAASRPRQKFHLRAQSIEEDEDVSGERVPPDDRAHLVRQSFERLAEAHRLNRHVHLHRRRQQDHVPSRDSASMTAANQSGGTRTGSETSMRTPRFWSTTIETAALVSFVGARTVIGIKVCAEGRGSLAADVAHRLRRCGHSR